MAHDGTVTIWLRQLREGETDAAQRVWEAYFKRMVGLARLKLQGRVRAVADEEDVALSAFHSFCNGVEQGDFPKLEDRTDLWPVLVMLTARKAANLRRRESALKRGGGAVLHSSSLSDEEAKPLEQVIGSEPTPEFAAELAEQFTFLLDQLDDDQLRFIALRKLEDHSRVEDRPPLPPKAEGRQDSANTPSFGYSFPVNTCPLKWSVKVPSVKVRVSRVPRG